MKRFSVPVLGLALALLAAAPPLTSARSVTLSVPGMYCPSCPVTVRKALERVHGVHVVKADLTHLTVEVKVTDSHITNRELTDATANAGYPSTVVKSNGK